MKPPRREGPRGCPGGVVAGRVGERRPGRPRAAARRDDRRGRADQRDRQVAEAGRRGRDHGSAASGRFSALLAGRDPESLLPGPSREAGPGNDAPADPASATGGLTARTGSVHLTMPASAWLDLSHVPGEVAGFGPLDAWTCRDLAARLSAGPGTRWCVTLTGSGRHGRRPRLCPRRTRPASRLRTGAPLTRIENRARITEFARVTRARLPPPGRRASEGWSRRIGRDSRDLCISRLVGRPEQ